MRRWWGEFVVITKTMASFSPLSLSLCVDIPEPLIDFICVFFFVLHEREPWRVMCVFVCVCVCVYLDPSYDSLGLVTGSED